MDRGASFGTGSVPKVLFFGTMLGAGWAKSTLSSTIGRIEVVPWEFFMTLLSSNGAFQAPLPHCQPSGL